MERYVNSGSPSGWHKRSTSPVTNPFTGLDSFNALEFDDSDIETIVYGNNAIFQKKVNYAHPDSKNSQILISSGRNIINSNIIVTPTSGARTMLIRNGEQKESGYLKLTYDIARIGRVDRQLTKKHCLACLEASSTIKKAVDNKEITSNFGIQLESSAKVSMIPYKDTVYEWGVVYREFSPYPYSNITTILVPGFSLLGTDYKSPSDKRLISQFIEKSGITPVEYLKELLLMIVDSYWQVVLSCGFHMEWHSQNCLFELADNFKLLRVITRYMDSVDRDIPLQKYLNVKYNWECFPVMCFDENIYYYKIRPSYMYDFKLGEYLLTPLINAVCEDFNLNPNSFFNLVKEYVRNTYFSKLPTWYFPEDNCWYSCDNSERLPGQIKRKYYAHENPKYR